MLSYEYLIRPRGLLVALQNAVWEILGEDTPTACWASADSCQTPGEDLINRPSLFERRSHLFVPTTSPNNPAI